jgi:hypothetical protein
VLAELEVQEDAHELEVEVEVELEVGELVVEDVVEDEVHELEVEVTELVEELVFKAVLDEVLVAKTGLVGGMYGELALGKTEECDQSHHFRCCDRQAKRVC